jgi:hypothetical protein
MSPALEAERIVVTGASGLIGRRLCAELESAGARVIRAVRRPGGGDGQIHWDPEKNLFDAAALEGVDAVVHLAGENVAGRRWSEAYKAKIRDSRRVGTRLVSEAIARAANRPRTLVCASAIGYYGNRGDELLAESSPPGDDFLAEVCQEWEAACQPARDAGVRVANARIGVVLSPEGGALKKMLTPFRMGVGGVIGDGRQYMSWTAIDDITAALMFLVAQPNVAGPVNLTAPYPVTNREFTKTLGRVLKRPTVFPMPAFAARLAFGEMADALLLSSTRVAPRALEGAGFKFRYPELEPALRHLLTP